MLQLRDHVNARYYEIENIDQNDDFRGITYDENIDDIDLLERYTAHENYNEVYHHLLNMGFSDEYIMDYMRVNFSY